MSEKTEDQQPHHHQQISGNITSLTVEELYDKDKFDLSTMEQGDVLTLLQYVSISFLHVDLSPISILHLMSPGLFF